MDTKKSKKADIEQHKATFLGVGFIVALSLALIAFEWSEAPDNRDTFVIRGGTEILPDIIIPNTLEKPPQKAPELRVPDLIYIVEDIIPLSTDIDWGTDIIDEGTDIPWDNLYIPEPDGPDDIPMVFVSEMPRFMGGTLSDFSAWVQKNVNYPVLASDNGIEEKIYLAFIIERDGTISSVEITRGKDASLIEEVKRVISKSPKWTPGSNMGIAARVKLSMVVNFKLQ